MIADDIIYFLFEFSNYNQMWMQLLFYFGDTVVLASWFYVKVKHILIFYTNWLYGMQHSIDIADFYKLCSIGNFFFAGARIFFQSLDAAVFLFSRVSDIPPESLVLPVISTNDRLTLGCELWVRYIYLTVKLSYGFMKIKCYS